MANKKSTWLDGVLGSQLRDTQGETLSVEGADISELEAGRGLWNDNHSKGAFNTLGRITYAKKIFKEEDCEDDRQRYFWNKVRTPYIYGKGYLFDDEDHPNARAAAAILRNIHKTDSPLSLKASVEGGVIARGIKDPTILARTKITKCALTFTPANNATLVEPISLDKSQSDEAADMLLIKSVLHLAQTNVPSFRHIVRDASASKVQDNLSKIDEMMRELGLEGLIEIPSKQLILQKALETKIHNNVLKIHDLVNLLSSEGDSMEKGIMNSIASAVTSAALSASPQVTSLKSKPQPINPQNTIMQQQKPTTVTQSGFGSHPVDRFLWNVQQVESSGGKNINHKQIQVGTSKGDRAIGKWGLLKNTIDEMINRAKINQKMTPDLKKIKSMTRDQIEEHFAKNPQSELNMARMLASHVMTKHKGHMGKAAYSWLYGHNLDSSDISDEQVNNSDYVQKVTNIDVKNPFKKVKRLPASKPLDKALMAGYGGAGAPSSRVSGAVVQSESLEGSPKFKFFSCDGCGDEQIYAPYQVKCRKCGTNLSLEKLHSILKKK